MRILFAILILATPAQAGIISYAFTGNLTTVIDPGNVTGRRSGEVFAGTLTYDTSLADLSGSAAYYKSTGPGVTASFTWPDQEFTSTGSGNFDVQGGGNNNVHIFTFLGPEAMFGLSGHAYATILFLQKNAPFQDAIPSSLSLSDFAYTQILIQASEGAATRYTMLGRLKTLAAPGAVPEPPGPALVGLLLLFAALTNPRNPRGFRLSRNI